MRFLIQGGTARLRFDGHFSSVLSLFLSDIVLVSGSTDRKVICWNPTNGNIIRTLTGHSDAVYTVGLFDEYVYSGGASRVVFKWNIENGEVLKMFPFIHISVVKCFAYRPSELFSGSIDTTVIRWNATSGAYRSQYRGRNKKLRALAAWKSFVISAGEDIEINIWDASIDSVEPLAVFTEHTLAINCLAIYDDSLYSGSSDKTVKQWNLQNFTMTTMFEGYPETMVSLTADQSFIYASGFTGDIYQWNVSSSDLTGIFAGHSNDVEGLKLVNSLLFSGSRDRTVRAWNIQTLETVKTFNGKRLFDTNRC